MDVVMMYWIWGILLGLLIGVGVILLYWKVIYPKLYEYTITLKEIVNGRIIARSCRGKIINNKKGADYFKLTGKKNRSLRTPIPPDDTIEVTNKGKKYVMGYVINNSQIVWGKDDLSTMSWSQDEDMVKSKIQPFTQEQRQTWINQEKKANRDKPMTWANMFAIAAPSMMILIIFIMALVFWQDITQPMLDAQQGQKEVTQKQVELVTEMQKLAKIYNGVEVITEDGEELKGIKDLEEKK